MGLAGECQLGRCRPTRGGRSKHVHQEQGHRNGIEQEVHYDAREQAVRLPVEISQAHSQQKQRDRVRPVCDVHAGKENRTDKDGPDRAVTAPQRRAVVRSRIGIVFRRGLAAAQP